MKSPWMEVKKGCRISPRFYDIANGNADCTRLFKDLCFIMKLRNTPFDDSSFHFDAIFWFKSACSSEMFQ